MKRVRTLSVLVLLTLAMFVPLAMAGKPAGRPFPDITLTGAKYNIFWEPTYHPRDGVGTVDDGIDWSHTDEELFPKTTGAVLHSWDTFENYPSYSFVDKHVLVYNRELKLHTIKGSSLEYVWMSDGALLHPDDVEAHVTENPETSVLYHMKDYFVGVAKFAKIGDHENAFHWMVYRQYSYWMQTEYSRDMFGFPEEIGERIHAEHEGETYVPSDELWQATSTYYVLREPRVPSDIGVGGSFVWLARIYNAFPESFRGFNYKWVPE